MPCAALLSCFCWDWLAHWNQQGSTLAHCGKTTVVKNSITIFQPSLQQPNSGQELQLREKPFLFHYSYRSCSNTFRIGVTYLPPNISNIIHDAFNPGCAGKSAQVVLFGKFWIFLPFFFQPQNSTRHYTEVITATLANTPSSPLVCQDTLQKCCPTSFLSSRNESDPSLFLTEAASDKSGRDPRSKIFNIKQTPSPLLHLKIELFWAERANCGLYRTCFY